MEFSRSGNGRGWGKLLRAIAIYAVVASLVAVLGAFVGWMLGSLWMGAVFGAVVGYFGCVLGGFVMGEPNVHRPLWS